MQFSILVLPSSLKLPLSIHLHLFPHSQYSIVIDYNVIDGLGIDIEILRESISQLKSEYHWDSIH